MALAAVTSTPLPFKPFLVQGIKNIFRVVELYGAPRARVEKMLGLLPVFFTIKTQAHLHAESLNEPLEVYLQHQLMQIYPPKARLIVTSGLTTSDPCVHARYLADIEYPGSGQVRSVLDIPVSYFKLDAWAPGMTTKDSIAVEIHTLYRGAHHEPKPPEMPHIEVRKLLETIAGGDKQITEEQLGNWRDIIDYAVEKMRLCYENSSVSEDDTSRQYFKECWERFAKAKTNAEVIEALEFLRSSIQWK